MSASQFGVPFVDIDEWRDIPRRHRYVHGGFEGTHTLFSFYFPPQEYYEGRFFQYLEGGAGGHESLLAASMPGRDMGWIFDLAFDELAGYLVESNQGHYPNEGLGFANDVELFGASAESALYAKQLATEMYGSAPHHGYIWGISGGGGRSTHCLENRPDVWDGGAPHCGVHLSSHWSAWALAWLVARHKFPAIVDAMEPGGSGSPFEGLTHAEREAVAELYRRGYPRGAENQLAPFWAWAFKMYGMYDEDPTYFDDFWGSPGYLGHDEPHIVAPYLVHERTTVREVLPASKLSSRAAQMQVLFATAGAVKDPSWGVRLDLSLDDPTRLFLAKVRVLSGKAEGRELLLSAIEGDVFSPFSERAPDVFQDVEPGDEVEIDNRDFIAYCYYHRYAIEGLVKGKDRVPIELQAWAVDGQTLYPQRQTPAGPPDQTGQFTTKMIYIQPTLDNMVWPNSISSYHRLVQDNLGPRIDNQFRLWWVENAAHGAPGLIGPAQTEEKDPKVWETRLVSYDGVTSQALRDLVRWVENDIAPPQTTSYSFSRDQRLLLPPSASSRGAIQPVVEARANGGIRADVKVGDPVVFQGTAEQAPGLGSIVSAEWRFDGPGDSAYSHEDIGVDDSAISVTVTHTYNEPGVYFPAFRVGAHRDGAKGRGVPVQNLARLRVIVHP